MAGESPDKTEQQKSSGTAAEERDPRFAVFRDPGADTGADADEEGGGDAGADARSGTGAAAAVTSDTATAVFRPRLPEDAAVTEPESKAESESTPESESDSKVESKPAGDSEPEVKPEADSGAADAAGTSDVELEAAATAPEGAATPPEASETAEAPEGADDADVEASAEESADEPEPEAKPEAGDVRLRAAVAAWVDAAADDKPAADDQAAADAGSQGEPEAGPAAEDEPKAAAEDDVAPDDVSDADADADVDADPAPAPKADADAEPDTGAAGASGGSDASGDAETGSDLRGIDQPTAVFKAVKPADRVDQATTALKLPPRESTSGSDAGSKSEGKPESAVERTSTFVPLRSDDVRSAPAPRKPEPDAADASGAAETPATPEAPGAPETSKASGAAKSAPERPAAGPAVPSWAGAERTRQQPLPPKPPLDLLAELTNTPPPVETPVRTAVRRVKIWTPLLLLLLIVFAIVQVMRPLPEPELKLTAKPTYAFEGDATKLSWPGQGQSAVMVDGVGSLGSEGAQKPAPIASVAKVMTAYVILEEHPLKGDEEGETITVDQTAEDESKRPDESTAPLTKGQQLSQRQMLQLLMIPSGNNAARLLARWDAGNEDAFIDKMNDAAKDLGMTNSTYTDPSGLEKTTVSTATDQLKLAQAVMRSEIFREIVNMPDVEIKGIDGKIYNNNTLLPEPGVSGIKTGSSTPAGGNLLWSANTIVDGKKLWIYGAVMGQQAGTGRVYDSLTLSLTNSLKLIKDAQEAPTSATVVKKGDVVGYVDNGFGGQTPVVATKNLKAVGWSGLEVELKVTDNGKGIDRTAKAGSEVGMVTVGTGTGKVTAPVVLQDDLTEPAFGDKLTRVG